MSESEQQWSPPEPLPEHRWLQQLIGTWAYESIHIGPDGAEMRTTGTERVRALGEVWVLGESDGETPGVGHGTSMITLGFDPAKQRFVGSWIGSMMHQMWLYEGGLDVSGTVLTLDTEGPHMTREGELGRYRDIVELTADGHRLMRTEALDDDGQWQPFLTMTYRRVE
jgi:hypothetical protein